MSLRTTISGAYQRIRDRQPFKAGKMDAKTGTFFGCEYSGGHAYVVYSYRWSYPLAVWIDGWGWFTHERKYSRTTSRHQSVTFRAIGNNPAFIEFYTLQRLADMMHPFRSLTELQTIPMLLSIDR